MIKRKILKNIESWLETEKILILKWARQVWKTTLMKEIEKKLKEKNKQTIFLSADNIDNINIFKNPENLIFYIKQKIDFKKYTYLFIDEFQTINNAWIFLKNIFDKYKKNMQIIVSGSSSLEITKNSEFLTWRAINFYIDRISFFDFFVYKEDLKNIEKINLANFEKLELFYSTFKNSLERNFLDYITYGSYPEIVNQKNTEKKEILISELVQTYIQKDIIHFLKIENINAFNNLIKLLSSNIWNLINISEIADTLNISMQTVNKYLDILEWTFVFSRVKPFFKNTRKELSKMPKIFIEDLSIKNYSLWEFVSIQQKIDIWAEVENFIYTELKKTINKDKIHFYRTISKSEIDFVIEKKYNIFDLIEVKYKNKVSSHKAFNNFSEKYNISKKIMITKNKLEKKADIYFIPASLFAFIEL